MLDSIEIGESDKRTSNLIPGIHRRGLGIGTGAGDGADAAGVYVIRCGCVLVGVHNLGGNVRRAGTAQAGELSLRMPKFEPPTISR